MRRKHYRKHWSNWIQLSVHAHCGCVKCKRSGGIGVLSRQTRLQRQYRLRWHMEHVAVYFQTGQYALAVRSAKAGEVLARNLGDTQGVVDCLLSRSKACWYSSRMFESAAAMEAAAYFIVERRVSPTPLMYERAVELCYRLMNAFAARGQFAKAVRFRIEAERNLRALARDGGNTDSSRRHAANLHWIDGNICRYRGEFEQASARYAEADDLYSKLPLEESTAKIKYERACVEIALAGRDSHLSNSADSHLARAGELLDECDSLMHGQVWGSLSAMAAIARRTIAVMRAHNVPDDTNELLHIASVAHKHNDTYVESLALLQALREAQALQRNPEADQLRQLAKSRIESMPDAACAARAMLRSELL